MELLSTLFVIFGPIGLVAGGVMWIAWSGNCKELEGAIRLEVRGAQAARLRSELQRETRVLRFSRRATITGFAMLCSLYIFF